MTEQKTEIHPFIFISKIFRHYRTGGYGLWLLFATLIILSVLTGFSPGSSLRTYVVGEIVERDIVADRDLLVEDEQATDARRKQLFMQQPQVYDLTSEPFTQYNNSLLELLEHLNSNTIESYAALDLLREILTYSVADEVLPQLAKPEAQHYLLKVLLPELSKIMSEGLVADIRTARIGRSGAIIRNIDNGSEILRSESAMLPNIQTLLTEISAQMRADASLDPQMRRAISVFLSSTLPVTLTFNQRETQGRAASVAENLEPIYYQVRKGERILRTGDRVKGEDQVKIQALYSTQGEFIQPWLVMGAFVFSLILSLGFFLTPSGKQSLPSSKDLTFFSLILFVFCGGAKIISLVLLGVSSPVAAQAYIYAYPVSMGVGLTAIVFAARRYFSIALLLSFFCALMFGGGLNYFLYYFSSAMVITWFVSHAQNRQDVVISIIPMLIWQLFFFLGAVALGQSMLQDIPFLAGAALLSAVVALLSLFALSPLLEMLFGYTTRFRLMELMSLEQNLMQDLMVSMPGTYHHSLVVANMVEAGAKAIGANSLLCKVAALYHDVGKLSYPSYFIENQFGGANKHDKLAPSMSALILISHVKKGTEVAEKYKLGEEIQNIIRQHHGTRLIRYFHQKALDMGDTPRESDYCYPGPRPQTKEAAIIMLADSVEASSRTLTDPTPARIRSHIDGIMKGIFSEGQLDESELTFRDLHLISECFVRILMGIFHQRIAYPPSAIMKGKQEGSVEKGEAVKSDETIASGKDGNVESDADRVKNTEQGEGESSSGRAKVKQPPVPVDATTVRQ